MQQVKTELKPFHERVIRELAQGKVNKEIADELNCTTAAISNAIIELRKKVNAKNTVQLIYFLTKEGTL